MNWFRGYQTGNWFLLNEAPKKKKKQNKKQTKKQKSIMFFGNTKLTVTWGTQKNLELSVFILGFFFLCPNGCKQPSRGKK